MAPSVSSILVPRSKFLVESYTVHNTLWILALVVRLQKNGSPDVCSLKTKKTALPRPLQRGTRNKERRTTFVLSVHVHPFHALRIYCYIVT